MLGSEKTHKVQLKTDNVHFLLRRRTISVDHPGPSTDRTKALLNALLGSLGGGSAGVCPRIRVQVKGAGYVS